MKVKVSWRDCAKYDYFDNYGCPLFHTLRKLGYDVTRVGGSAVWIGNKEFPIVTHFDSERVRWSTRRHRSIEVVIRGLQPLQAQ